MRVDLVMFKENGERKSITLQNDVSIVGRKEDCDVRIPLAEVSRRHAQISIGEKNVRLKDLGSANGTFVNNKRVKDQALAPGDHVVIGPVVFTIQIDGDPSDIRPVKTKLRRQSHFTAEDNLAAASGKYAPAKKTAPSSEDSKVLEALEAIGEGSSLGFELDDSLDLGDSVFKEE